MEDLMFQRYSEFMTKVAKIEELVEVGSRLLVGFHQGLEFIRRPPINKTSGLVERIYKATETEWLSEYGDAGCKKTHDSVKSIIKLHTCHRDLCDHLSEAKCSIEELEDLVKKVASEMLGPKFENEVPDDGLYTEVNRNDEGKTKFTDYAAMMSFVYNMVKQDFDMRKRIISSLGLKLTSEELESYSLMWSLRPFIDEEIMHQAWKLIQ